MMRQIVHLFFVCPVAKFAWAIIAQSIGADSRPRN
ncbi:hypothetical protein SEVIR_6G083601v4 [Setaria viridis]